MHKQRSFFTLLFLFYLPTNMIKSEDTALVATAFVAPIISLVSKFISQYTHLQSEKYKDTLRLQIHSALDQKSKISLTKKLQTFMQEFNAVNKISAGTDAAHSTTLTSLLISVIGITVNTQTNDELPYIENGIKSCIGIAGVSSLIALGCAISNHKNFIAAKNKSEKTV